MLIHFKNYMDGVENKSQMPVHNPKKRLHNPSTEVVYVKRWMKTKHAILFRLSNKVVQVIFEDKSELTMSS